LRIGDWPAKIPYDLSWIGERLPSTGHEERIGVALPGETFVDDVSMDGKEILWIRTYHPSKLVLVKNLFE